jgi:hypothetical protein
MRVGAMRFFRSQQRNYCPCGAPHKQDSTVYVSLSLHTKREKVEQGQHKGIVQPKKVSALFSKNYLYTVPKAKTRDRYYHHSADNN